MKKTMLSALALLSLTVQANELPTFNDVAKVVSAGKPITFVVNFKECSAQNHMPALVASITPNAVMIVNNSRITASDRHFTMDDPIARGTPVFDYSKFNIDAAGGASIKISMMNASTYEVLGDMQINCELGKGFKVFG